MRLLPDWLRLPQRSSPEPGGKPLTRKAFYDLAADTRAIARELARFDQHRVVLRQCHEFNEWLAVVQQFDQLALRLGDMPRARPVARWQILTIGLVIGLFLLLLLPPQLGPVPGSVLIYGYIFTLIAFFFVPESYYGTTIELLEAKMLRIVEELEAILQNQSLGFSEAAYFQAKSNLLEAKRELRQQLDLAHRQWR